MERNLDNHALPLLLSRLKDKKRGSSTASLVNATTIDLIYKLLSQEDYISFAAQLTDASDAKNTLDFILHLLRRSTTLTGTVDIRQRARQFMLKVVTKTTVIPESLIVTGIRMPAEHDYIARGGFGHVFRGELRGENVALKVLYKADNNVAFCREALMWRSLSHKFVLEFLGIYQDERMEQFFLVSPYMQNGTLAQWRKEANPSIVDVEERMLEVAKGIEYIHSEGIVHGDLRGVNVLLDANLHVQIADFGLTRLSEAMNTRSGALHVNFAAPELFGCCEDDDSVEDDVPIGTQKSDVYAFGCLYYEIHYDAIPFAGKTEMQILTLHSRGLHPPRLHEPPLTDNIWELIRSCWVREASRRPRIEEVMKRMAALFQSVSSTLALTSGTPSRAPSRLATSSTISYFNVLAMEQTPRAPPRVSLRPSNALCTPPLALHPPPAHTPPQSASPPPSPSLNPQDPYMQRLSFSTNFPPFFSCPAFRNEPGQSYILPTPNPDHLYYQLSPQMQPPGMEGVTEMATMYSTPALSCPDSMACNSPCIHTPYFSASPAQSSSPSTSAFKTPASSFTPISPISRCDSQTTRQSGLAITARDPSCETSPRAPWSAPNSSTAPPSNEKDLSAALTAKLEHYSSPNFGNLRSKFSTIQQSDENVDVLTAWQNVTLNPGFKLKDEELHKLYNELIDKAKYDGTKIVLNPFDVLHISLAFTILRSH